MARRTASVDESADEGRERLVGGWHAVRTLLGQGAEAVAWIGVDRGRRDQRARDVLALARQLGVTVERLEGADLDTRAGALRHQGVLALARAPAALGEDSLDTLLAGLTEDPLLLILDGVQDPHNLGACLRTADAAGVQAVITPRDKAVGLTKTTVKVACGAAQSIPFIQVTNLARTLRHLREVHGLRLVGAAGEAATPLGAVDLTGPLALVMGGEEKGLRRLTREACDALLAIPMLGVVESLNVSVATGVCLYEALRQRRPG